MEGVGGLAVPINETEMVVDLASKLKFPILIISKPGLGTINHTLLTIDYAKSHGLRILGVIFNDYVSILPNEIDSLDEIARHPEQEKSELTNPFVVHKFSGIKILGKIPHVPDSVGLDEQIRILNCHIHIDSIISTLNT